jgi:hypothetical protein
VPDEEFFVFKTVHGEMDRIDISEMPSALMMSACLVRDRLKRDSGKSVEFSFWKHVDTESQPKNMPGNFKWQTDNELSSYRMMLTCLMNDLDTEMKARHEYRKMVSDEIAGLTGSDGGKT